MKKIIFLFLISTLATSSFAEDLENIVALYDRSNGAVEFPLVAIDYDYDLDDTYNITISPNCISSLSFGEEKVFCDPYGKREGRFQIATIIDKSVWRRDPGYLFFHLDYDKKHVKLVSLQNQDPANPKYVLEIDQAGVSGDGHSGYRSIKCKGSVTFDRGTMQGNSTVTFTQDIDGYWYLDLGDSAINAGANMAHDPDLNLDTYGFFRCVGARAVYNAATNTLDFDYKYDSGFIGGGCQKTGGTFTDCSESYTNKERPLYIN